MALYDMFNKRKPKKKAAKKKPVRSGRAATRSRELVSRGAAGRAAAAQEVPDTATIAKGKPRGGGGRGSVTGTSPAPRPRTSKVRASGTSPAPRPRTSKVRVSAKPVAKKAAPKKAAAKKTSFKSAFADARKAQGAGGTFTWGGKKYTTDREDDKKKSPGSSAYNKKMMAKSPQGRMRSRMGRTRGRK